MDYLTKKISDNRILLRGWLHTKSDCGYRLFPSKNLSESDQFFQSDDLVDVLDDVFSEALEWTDGEVEATGGGMNQVVGKGVAPRVALRFFASDKELTLEQAEEFVILDTMGLLLYENVQVMYSEYTILEYDIHTLTIGNHDIENILSNHLGKYILMDFTFH